MQSQKSKWEQFVKILPKWKRKIIQYFFFQLLFTYTSHTLNMLDECRHTEMRRESKENNNNNKHIYL